MLTKRKLVEEEDGKLFVMKNKNGKDIIKVCESK